MDTVDSEVTPQDENDNHEGSKVVPNSAEDDPTTDPGVTCDIDLPAPVVACVSDQHTLSDPVSHEDDSGVGAQSPRQSSQRSPSPQELVVMEGIFEPRPSTSRDSGINRLGGGSSTSDVDQVQISLPAPTPHVAAERAISAPVPTKSRTRLTIIPRTTQYEKHPLLQIRSDSGLSEFDLLLMEREPRGPRAMSLEGPPTHTVQVLQRRLIPRAAHYQESALFERTPTGVSQLEEYLSEREAELVENCEVVTGAQHSTTTTESGIGTLSEASDASPATTHTLVAALLDPAADPRRPALVHSKSVPESHGPTPIIGPRYPALQPRQTQYEQHHLLQSKDDKGISELQHFLQEMEDEMTEKGKCSTKCTCKNVHCAKCKAPQTQTLTHEVDMVTRIEPKTNNKRVHFQRQDCVEVPPERDKRTTAAAETQNNHDTSPATPPPDSTAADTSTVGDAAAAAPAATGDNNSSNVTTAAKNSHKKSRRNKSRCTIS